MPTKDTLDKTTLFLSAAGEESRGHPMPPQKAFDFIDSPKSCAETECAHSFSAIILPVRVHLSGNLFDPS
jgi:hypothetical protein